MNSLQAVCCGDYHGHCSVGDILMNGDTGLGTFEGLSGDMIILDSVCYSINYDGMARVVGVTEQSPYAVVALFQDDLKANVFSLYDLDTLVNILNTQVKKTGVNNIYCVKVEANFNEVEVLVTKPQQKPYVSLKDVIDIDGKIIKHQNLLGTLVGFYYPDYLGHVGKHGWMFSFLSRDKTRGGHVVNINAAMATVTVEVIENINIEFPDSNFYQSLKLTDVNLDFLNIKTNRFE